MHDRYVESFCTSLISNVFLSFYDFDFAGVHSVKRRDTTGTVSSLPVPLPCFSRWKLLIVDAERLCNCWSPITNGDECMCGSYVDAEAYQRTHKNALPVPYLPGSNMFPMLMPKLLSQVFFFF